MSRGVATRISRHFMILGLRLSRDWLAASLGTLIRCVAHLMDRAYIVAALLMASPAIVVAATATTTFNVQITIANACTIVSASNMNFGSVGVIGATGVAATGTISVQCTALAPYSIGLSAGAGSGATVANRLMTSAATNTIGYSLYQDVAHVLVWGATIGTDTVAGIGTGTTQSVTVYGYVPSQATPAAGVYNDTITVTVTY